MLKAARNFLTRLASVKLQATSRKRQATSCKLCKVQAASSKLQAIQKEVGSKAL
jgi:hypothetical protein